MVACTVKGVDLPRASASVGLGRNVLVVVREPLAQRLIRWPGERAVESLGVQEGNIRGPPKDRLQIGEHTELMLVTVPFSVTVLSGREGPARSR